MVLDGENSRWFDVNNGLRQGCPLSPLLYSIFVMGMVQELKRKGVGVMVEEVWCGGLYAALVADSEEELQVMLDVVGAYAEKWKFRFNCGKSKVMVIGKYDRKCSWCIGGGVLEVVESFKYLGLWFDRRMKGSVEYGKMIEKAEEWMRKIEWMSRVNGVVGEG